VVTSKQEVARIGTAVEEQAQSVLTAADADCRSCGAPLAHTFVDLGSSPLANSYLSADQLERPEIFYPLHVYVCERCFLVQLPSAISPEELFSDYAYLSSYSDSWRQHAKEYVGLATSRFGLDPTSRVVEIASNDGYLLQYFRDAGVPVLGVEPARNAAEAAERAGIRTIVRFFGLTTAHELAAAGESADLIVANNVLAHVPLLNDFVAGIRALLHPQGVATLEFPHLSRLIEKTEFDTIYHEHLCYFSLLAVQPVFAQNGLMIFDVEELPTHGGSLRIYACRSDAARAVEPAVEELHEREREEGLEELETFGAFAERVLAAKCSLLEFLIGAKQEGKDVVGYGAPAKGNTLLNYCGIRRDFLDYVVDRSPLKQGLFLPGTHIPIFDPGRIAETRPDYVLILPWNLQEEVLAQMSHVRDFGCRFVVPIPKTRVLT
jgi:SAM-dependent methyltransferase